MAFSCDMNKEKRLKHAYNNLEACKYLNQSGNFRDWVITTAYYSALHFVSYLIFPYKQEHEDGRTYELQTLDEYYSFNNLSNGKHNELANIVADDYPSISADFDWLKDLCMTARYKNYYQSKADSERAIKLLDIIIKELNIPKLAE